jgi:hypothetical protein
VQLGISVTTVEDAIRLAVFAPLRGVVASVTKSLALDAVTLLVAGRVSIAIVNVPVTYARLDRLTLLPLQTPQTHSQPPKQISGNRRKDGH